MAERFKNQVAVVTGSARGIGFAAARLLALEGAHVVVNDLEDAAVKAAAATIAAEGGQVTALAGDVTEQETVREHVALVLDKLGRIDVLVNNAGIIRRDPSATVDLQSWRRVLAVNLDGVFIWSQAVAAATMIPQRSGSIVNVASAAGVAAIPNAASYVASKHAVVGLTRALAVDWGRYNIRVNAVCPGLTRTDLSAADRARNPGPYANREGRIPLGRAATVDEVAQAILFLASSDAAYVHALIMSVDGGGLAMASWHTAPKYD